MAADGSKKSEINEVFRSDRHRAVHHSKLNGEELKKTLTDAADEKARIAVYDELRRCVIEFPEAAIVRSIYGDVENSAAARKALKRRAALAQAALGRFKELFDAALAAQCARKKIDPARLYHRMDGSTVQGHDPDD